MKAISHLHFFKEKFYIYKNSFKFDEGVIGKKTTYDNFR